MNRRFGGETGVRLCPTDERGVVIQVERGGDTAWALRDCVSLDPVEAREFAEAMYAAVAGAVCACDDLRCCSYCFDQAEALVGEVVRDSDGREWVVREAGEKDGCPTISGEYWWARPDDVTVLEREADRA